MPVRPRIPTALDVDSATGGLYSLSVETEEINRVAFITVHGDTASSLLRRLTESGFSATKVESAGGMLLEPTCTIVSGFPETRFPTLMAHVRELCQTRTRLIPTQPDGAIVPVLPSAMVEVETGGATVMVLAVERYIQF